MKIFKLKHVLVIGLFTSLIGLTACQEKGPAEKAGEKIDNALGDGQNAVEDAANDIEDAADDAADAVKDATN